MAVRVMAATDYIHCEVSVTAFCGIINRFSMAIRRISLSHVTAGVALGWFWFPMEGTPT
jgi:hypothetical protein